MSKQSAHFVAIVGGGIAGSEAAYQLSQRGINSVLFEQNHLPYGKIEEGLPKWHINLRNQEEQKIDDKLQLSGVHFVPGVRFGHHIRLKELLDWGFSAVLLAFGAWRDRRLLIPEIDQYIGKGFYYQNAFVSWFNHNHQTGYSGPICEVRDQAIVVGGGLASLDVAKILMLESTVQAMCKQNYPADILTLEREGITAVLKKYNLNFRKLGLHGCTIFYRKRIIDMPLAPMPENVEEKRKEKIYELRRRILQNFQQKYLFKVEECHSPVDKIVSNDRMQGLIFQKNRYLDGAFYANGEERLPVHSPLVISAIGSVPEVFPEVPVRDELLDIEDSKTGKLRGFDNVFALGNAVTGRGNIRESLIHSRDVSRQIMEEFLSGNDFTITEQVRAQENNTRKVVAEIGERLRHWRLPPAEVREQILRRIREMQQRVGYAEDYPGWIQRYRPPRLEDQ